MELKSNKKFRVPRAQVAALVRPSFVGANPRPGSVRALMSEHEGERHSMFWATMTDRVSGAPAVACFEVDGTTWYGYVPGQVQSATVQMGSAEFRIAADGAGTFCVELLYPPAMNKDCDAWSAFMVLRSAPDRSVSAA